MAQATGQRPAVKPFNPSHALEPNPFEQSFCSKPSTSSSPVDSILSSAGGPSTGATSISSQRTKDLNQNEDTSPSSQRESPLAGIDGGNVKAGSPSLSGENKGDSNSVGMSRSRNGSEMGKNDSTNANGIDSNSPNSKNGNVNGSSGSSSGGGGGIHSITTPKPLLPGVASMASPGSLGGYGWNSSLASSLRTGPLSPAMLAGPHSSGSGGHQHQHSSSGSGFDISSFRTGFTPDLNNYKTGLTPLGSSASNIPPPSPSTAALIALMNSSSNGSSSPLGGVNSSTMTPNTLAALANHHHNNLSPSNHHHHGGNNSGYFGREHSGAFDLAFGRSLSEKKVSRLRTSSGREVGIEDDDDQEAREEESRKNQKEADSLINTDGGIEDHQVKVKTEENGSSLDDGNASRSNEQSRRSSQVKGQPNSRPDTTSNRNQNESSDGLHLLHRAAHDVGNHPQPPSSNHYQQQQQQHHSQQQHQHHQQQQLRHHQQQYEHPPNPHPLPPQSGQVVSSSSTRLPLTNGATINSNPSQLYSSSNKRRNPDAESTKEDPSSNYQTTGGAASSSKGKGKKARTSNASRGKSTETPQQFGSPDLAGQSNRGSAAPSETASIDLDELDDKPESKAGKGKKKAKDVDDEPQSEEAKRKEFLERNRQAALKCRQRKKAWVQDLQSRNAELEVQNETLQHTLASMKQEMDSLRMQLMSRDRDNNNGGGGNGNSSNHRGGRPTEERGVNSSSDLASGMVGNMATGIPPQSYRQSSIGLPNSHHNPGLPQQQQHQHQHQHHPHHQQHSSSNHHHQGMARSPPNHLAQLPRR